jgi:hypothetical protein
MRSAAGGPTLRALPTAFLSRQPESSPVRVRSLRLALLAAALCTACGASSDDHAAAGDAVAAADGAAYDAPEGDDAGAASETCDGAGLGALAEIRRVPPLTGADLDRYLKVMQDAAARRTRLTPEERDLIARAEALQRRALTEGLPATAEAAIEANTLMSRADTLRRHLDVVVTREAGASVACWALLRDRVEAIVPIPSADGTSGIYGDESDAVGQADPDDREPVSAEEAEVRRRLDALRVADSVVVTARRGAIVEALRAVRY